MSSISHHSTISHSTVVSNAIPTSTQSCGDGVETPPDGRPLCAISDAGNTTRIYGVLNGCCLGQTIVEYSNNCAAYCLAQEQIVGALVKCLSKNSGEALILCSSNLSAMGNETASPAAAAGVPAAVVDSRVSKLALALMAFVIVGSGAGMFL